MTDTRKLRDIGKTQRSVLECLSRHNGQWHMGCGWLWDTYSNTARILESLTKYGFVEKTTHVPVGFKFIRTTYHLTDAGRLYLEAR